MRTVYPSVLSHASLRSCFLARQPPRLAVTVTAVRTDRLDHPADEHVAELALVTVTIHAVLHCGVDVAADRPTGCLRPATTATLSRTSNTRTSRYAIAAFQGYWTRRSDPQQHRSWRTPDGPTTGDKVVPCSWRDSPHGGPMLLASDTVRSWHCIEVGDNQPSA